MSKSIKILHLSDIHFSVVSGKTDKDKQFIDSRKRCFSKLIEATKEFKGEIDFVVVSGDIANTGAMDEFMECKKLLLDKINIALSDKEKKDGIFDYSRYLFSCGNHDLNRDSLLNKVIPLVDKKLEADFEKLKLDSIKNSTSLVDKKKDPILANGILKKQQESFYKYQRKIVTTLANDKFVESNLVCKYKNGKCNECGSKIRSSCRLKKYFKGSIKDYIKFIESLYDTNETAYLENKFTTKFKRHWTEYLFGDRVLESKNGQKIRFRIFNSSWLCMGNDYGKLFLFSNLMNYSNEERQSEPIVSIMHHPPSWLHWSEKNTDFGSPNFGLISKYSKVILTGHEHDRHARPPSYYDSKVLLFSSGSTFDTFHYPNNVKILELQFDETDDKLSYINTTYLKYNYRELTPAMNYWESKTDNINYPVDIKTKHFGKTHEEIFWEKEATIPRKKYPGAKIINEFLIKKFLEDFDLIFEDLDISIKKEFYLFEESGISYCLKTYDLKDDLIEFESNIANVLSKYDDLHQVIIIPYTIINRDIADSYSNYEAKFGFLLQHLSNHKISIINTKYITRTEVNKSNRLKVPFKEVNNIQRNKMLT